MKNISKKIALSVAAIAAFSFIGMSMPGMSTAFADITTHGTPGKPGPDKNIKRGPSNNSQGTKITPPPTKGGPKTRASVSTLHVNNHTNLYVQIYVDGDYAGTVGPYGDLYPSVYSGTHTLYAKAVYDDGTYSDFGPRTTAISGTFVWSLYS